MYPGEYNQPLPRKHFVQCPVVSGYVTARLQAEDVVDPVSPSGPLGNVAFVFENVGGTAFSVKVNSTYDRSVSGARVLVCNAGTLVPGGFVMQTGATAAPYIEIYGEGLTNYFEGSMRLQIDSIRQWREMGFDRTDPFYPPKLWRATVTPTAIP
jgi:hypothetical protein